MTFNFQSRTNTILQRLRFLGAWFKNDSYDLYFAYAVLLNMYYNVHNITETIYIIKNLDDLEEWSSTGLITMTTWLTNLKAYCIVKNKKHFLRVNEIVTELSFQPKNPHQEKIADCTFKIFDRLYFVHSLGPTLTVVFFTLYSLSELKNEKTLPFSAWYPYDFRTSPYFELTYFFQFTTCMVQAQLHVHTDALGFYLIAILTMQLDFLADDLRNMSKTSEENKCSLDQTLLQCIAHHKEILT